MLVALLLLALPSAAFAEATDDPELPPKPAKPPLHYGWQTGVVDGLSLSLVAVGLGLGSSTAAWTGGVAYVAGAPMVHGAHRQYPQALIGAGMRVVAPALGCFSGTISALIIAPPAEGELNETLAIGCLAGAFVGAAVTTGIDVSILSREGRIDPRMSTDAKRRPSVQLAPRLAFDPRRSSAEVGLGGSF